MQLLIFFVKNRKKVGGKGTNTLSSIRSKRYTLQWSSSECEASRAATSTARRAGEHTNEQCRNQRRQQPRCRAGAAQLPRLGRAGGFGRRGLGRRRQLGRRELCAVRFEAEECGGHRRCGAADTRATPPPAGRLVTNRRRGWAGDGGVVAGGELLGRRLLARLRLLRHTRCGRVVRHRAAQHLVRVRVRVQVRVRVTLTLTLTLTLTRAPPSPQ